MRVSWDSIREKIELDFPNVDSVSTDELAAWLDDPQRENPVLIDARSEKEFVVSHLADAVHAESVDDVLELIGDHSCVVYCSVGYRSARLVAALNEAGLENVKNLDGSIFQWANDGRPVYQDHRQVQDVHPFDSKWGKLLETSVNSMNRRLAGYCLIGMCVGMLILFLNWRTKEQVRWFKSFDRVTLYSIDGRELPGQGAREYSEYFHGIPVLGKAELSPGQRDRLLNALNIGISEGFSQANCFWPRHGIRLEREGVVTDYVICFQCNYMKVFEGEKFKVVLTSENPRSTFNKILLEANITIVPE